MSTEAVLGSLIASMRKKALAVAARRESERMPRNGIFHEGRATSANRKVSGPRNLQGTVDGGRIGFTPPVPRPKMPPSSSLISDLTTRSST